MSSHSDSAGRDVESRDPHPTVPVQVWADIDVGIAHVVRYLNTIPGVRTHASCQGTIGEGGPAPYRAHIMASWDDEADARVRAEFDVEPLNDDPLCPPAERHGYLHAKGGADRFEAPAAGIRCSFCGKTKEQVRDMVWARTSARICNECVARSAEIIAEKDGRQALFQRMSGAIDVAGATGRTMVAANDLSRLLDMARASCLDAIERAL